MNVHHFRLMRPGYPRHDYLAASFRMVCEAPDQFESVYKNSKKFLNSTEESAESLRKNECSDLDEALEAIRVFMEKGPNPDYQYDNFRGYRPNGRGTHIGRSRFMLSKDGKIFLAKTP